MDSLPTGSDELIYIGTSKISLVVKGPACHPLFQKAETAESVSQLRVYCQDTDYDIALLGKHVEVETTGAYAVMPLFYEQQRYELVIEGLVDDDSIEFWHDNVHIRNKVTPLGRNRRMLSGVICFGNEIGFSDLVIRVNGREYLRVVIEVYPSKISYKEDYQAIVSDITAEVYNLIFDVLKKTYLSYRQNANVSGSFVEFFAIIRKIYGDLVRAVDMILVRPHHQLENNQTVLPSYKIRQCSTHTMRWLERHPNHVLKASDGWRVDKALAVRKRVSYDTRENRLTKFILKTITQKIGEFKRRYLRLCSTQDEAILRELDSMSSGIVRRCSHGFLMEVNEGEAAPEMSLVFTMAPGYRELYKYYLMLLHGLALTGDVFNISVKDMALLYEYWCFIKLNSMMRNSPHYELVSQDVVQVQNSGLYVTLTKGRASCVKYRNSRNGELITLMYNPKEIQSPTVSQKPDNVLTLEKQGTKIPYKYIFDAKYRINPAMPGTDYYLSVGHIPGPEIGDINTMHRYRDAIVYDHEKEGKPYERSMFGAYVLFPYGDEAAYEKHRFYQSIERVNIGGLPFLPSATSMVEDMLTQLIADSSESAFERTTLPVGIEEKLARIDWTRREVLIGTLRHKEQLDVCLKHKFYHIPADKLKDKDFPVRYVALYQSKNLFGAEAGIRYYGEVMRCVPLPRRKIREIPSRSKDLYYRFEIKEWKELPAAIEAKEIGFVKMSTNYFLLRHSTEVPELWIQSGEEYRLYAELKRLSNQFVIGGKEDAMVFSMKNYMFSVMDNQIVVSMGKEKRASYPVVQFIKSPNTMLRMMRKDLNWAQELEVE